MHSSRSRVPHPGPGLPNPGGSAWAARAGASLAAALVLAASPARAEPAACFQNNGRPPGGGLTGMLRQGHFLGPNRPPDGSPTFYVLDLRAPICLDEAVGGPTLQNIRSVHVYTTDGRTAALLDTYRDQRVTVRFSSVAPASEDHHRRPMIGAVQSVSPEP